MISGEVRCEGCHKLLILDVKLIEGEIKIYCPRCKHFHVVKASTVVVRTAT